MNLIVSLFSVFVNNQWEPINVFIQNECPFVMKSGFECLKMNSFRFAAFGVRFHQSKYLVSYIKAYIDRISDQQHYSYFKYKL